MNERNTLISSTDNPETYASAPISLQLVGRRYEDEKIVGILSYIQEKIPLPFESYYDTSEWNSRTI